MNNNKLDTPQPMVALVIMGVSGCGKSSAGQAIAQQLGWELVEGDSYHSQQSVDKMAAGIALNDEDRQGWLERLAQRLTQASASHSLVLTCSALKHKYREQLRSAQRLGFVFLELTPEVAADRVAHRPGHFMPKTLIDSQFATLESPADEPLVLTLNAAQMDIDQLAHAARDWWCEQSVLVTS